MAALTCGRSYRASMRKSAALVIPAIVGVVLSGCGNAFENAKVTVSYASGSETEELSLVRREEKQHIEEAFQRFSKNHGYKCHSNIKRVEQITCRGPDGLHLTFQPSLNRPEFVAHFSWANVAGRTHDEFLSHVATFQTELSSEVGKDRVRLEEGS